MYFPTGPSVQFVRLTEKLCRIRSTYSGVHHGIRCWRVPSLFRIALSRQHEFKFCSDYLRIRLCYVLNGPGAPWTGPKDDLRSVTTPLSESSIRTTPLHGKTKIADARQSARTYLQLVHLKNLNMRGFSGAACVNKRPDSGRDVDPAGELGCCTLSACWWGPSTT